MDGNEAAGLEGALGAGALAQAPSRQDVGVVALDAVQDLVERQIVRVVAEGLLDFDADLVDAEQREGQWSARAAS